jgi:hypothetical protein
MPKFLVPFRPDETTVKVECHDRVGDLSGLLLRNPPRLMESDVQFQFSAKLKGQTLFTRYYFSAAYFR